MRLAVRHGSANSLLRSIGRVEQDVDEPDSNEADSNRSASAN